MRKVKLFCHCWKQEQQGVQIIKKSEAVISRVINESHISRVKHVRAQKSVSKKNYLLSSRRTKIPRHPTCIQVKKDCDWLKLVGKYKQLLYFEANFIFLIFLFDRKHKSFLEVRVFFPLSPQRFTIKINFQFTTRITFPFSQL